MNYHFIEDVNLVGKPVLTRFSLRVRHDRMEVHQRVIVDGITADDTFYPLDFPIKIGSPLTGRDRLANFCIAPDMLKLET